MAIAVRLVVAQAIEPDEPQAKPEPAAVAAPDLALTAVKQTHTDGGRRRGRRNLGHGAEHRPRSCDGRAPRSRIEAGPPPRALARAAAERRAAANHLQAPVPDGPDGAAGDLSRLGERAVDGSRAGGPQRGERQEDDHGLAERRAGSCRRRRAAARKRAPLVAAALARAGRGGAGDSGRGGGFAALAFPPASTAARDRGAGRRCGAALPGSPARTSEGAAWRRAGRLGPLASPVAPSDERLLDLLQFTPLAWATWTRKHLDVLLRDRGLERLHRRWRKVPGFWPSVERRIGGAIEHALRPHLTEILTDAWNSLRGLPDTDEALDVPLGQRSVTWSSRPTVSIFVDGARVGRLRLQIMVEVAVSGVTAVVREAASSRSPWDLTKGPSRSTARSSWSTKRRCSRTPFRGQLARGCSARAGGRPPGCRLTVAPMGLALGPWTRSPNRRGAKRRVTG